MPDRRTAPRQQALIKAIIEAGGVARAVVTSCTVWNIPAIGACVGVICQHNIPDQFNLIIPKDNSRHTCRVIWRKQKQNRISLRLGVTFQ